ncbi:MAG: hypothetical protein IM638_17565 [Bacteroidetes bacterium]|nr:hypothetical protein [Bacteroidota bacterium]
MKTSDDLFDLIHSLSKGEKQKFKRDAAPGTPDKEGKYVQLFDIYDSLSEYDPKKLGKKIKAAGLEKNITILRSRLYRAILESVSYASMSSPLKQVFEQLIFAEFLGEKELKEQQQKFLFKAADTANDYNIHPYAAAILTDCIKNSVPTLKNESEISTLFEQTQRLQQAASEELDYYKIDYELNMLVQHNGLISTSKMDKALESIKNKFIEIEGKYPGSNANYQLREMILGAIAFIEKDIEKALLHVNRQIDMIETSEKNLRFRYKLLTLIYWRKVMLLSMVGKVPEIEDEFIRIDTFLNKVFDGKPMPMLVRLIYRLKIQTPQVYLANREYKRGLEVVKKQELHANELFADLGMKVTDVYWYNLMYLYLANGDYKGALQTSFKFGSQDDEVKPVLVRVYMRLLTLITHYELGNYELVQSMVTSIKNKYTEILENLAFEQNFLLFARKQLTAPCPPEKFSEYITSQAALLKPEGHKLYFDFSLWFHAKAGGQTIVQHLESGA